jgi:hypothetical protein
LNKTSICERPLEACVFRWWSAQVHGRFDEASKEDAFTLVIMENVSRMGAGAVKENFAGNYLGEPELFHGKDQEKIQGCSRDSQGLWDYVVRGEACAGNKSEDGLGTRLCQL